MAQGFDVIAAGPRDHYADAIEELGVHFEHIPMNPAGMSPMQELIELYFERGLATPEQSTLSRIPASTRTTIRPIIPSGSSCSAE